MDFESIMLNEVSQMEKDKITMISFICGLQMEKQQMNKTQDHVTPQIHVLNFSLSWESVNVLGIRIQHHDQLQTNPAPLPSAALSLFFSLACCAVWLRKLVSSIGHAVQSSVNQSFVYKPRKQRVSC